MKKSVQPAAITLLTDGTAESKVKLKLVELGLPTTSIEVRQGSGV